SDGLVIGRYRNRAEEIGHRDAQKNHYGGSYEDGGYFEFLCQWRLLGVRAGRSRLSQIGPHVLHHRLPRDLRVAASFRGQCYAKPARFSSKFRCVDEG
ncbi:MAG: hypothetical protein WA854_02260, partial [Candidatus Binataceae bacterium]